NLDYLVLKELQERVAQMSSFFPLAQSEESPKLTGSQPAVSIAEVMIDNSILMLQQWNSLPPDARARLLQHIQAMPSIQKSAEGCGPAKHQAPSQRRARGSRRRKGSGSASAQDGTEVLPVGPLSPPMPRFSEATNPSAISVQQIDGKNQAQGAAAPINFGEKILELTRIWQDIQDNNLGEVMAAQSGDFLGAQANGEQLAERLRAMTQFFSGFMKGQAGQALA
ncbi:unnamed protein product, partial [Polarella glacialis]